VRDIALLSVIAALLIPTILHPWIGVLAWTWVSIMNPHRYTWAAAELPVAAAVAIATFIGLVLTRDRLRIPITPVTVVLVLFVLWMCATTFTAFNVDESLQMLNRVVKIQVMVLVTIAVLQTRRHGEYFVWVIVLSLGFYGIKGGAFTLLTGGEFRVWGPPGTFIEGNNELALALIMTIPLMRYLQLVAKQRWIRIGLGVAMILSAAAALGTYSRGALLALVAMAGYLWLRSSHKATFGALMLMFGVVLIAFLPEGWEQRMWTIRTYEQDESALGRINAWTMAWNLARDRLFGGGFDVYTYDIFARYAPIPEPRAAHSIYFQVLGEHGIIGLALFVSFWLLVWHSASWVNRHGRKSEETMWTAQLATMCQVGLVGYAVGGAFLSLAYFDLPYNLMALVLLARFWLEERAKGVSRQPSRPVVAREEKEQVIP